MRVRQSQRKKNPKIPTAAVKEAMEKTKAWKKRKKEWEKIDKEWKGNKHKTKIIG